MRPYQVEYVQLHGWDAEIVGLWLAENEEWLLLHYIPVDYVVDGYVLISKAHIATRIPNKSQQQAELVLRLKGVKQDLPSDFRFADTLSLLRWTEQQYGLVHFVEEEDSTYLGWLNEADVVHFWIDTLEPNGTKDIREENEKPFAFHEIRLIVFGDDYSQSMKLLWQHHCNHELWETGNN
ncbi:hypothetical protein [Hymenobacter rigui]|uniref:Uncharacterized protein n=1 Tax=Hymenobacter rigui TaxID=334424 RepID=A0A428KX90_9BACT|nr:hypothetical protein [Hymenobacter rigui]RSK51332.1 hypothetical protein EI291_03200 [Hymenobacter rigui]